MQKSIITNKITPCCNLPFSVVYWWVSNLTLNSEADRSFILSKISQKGTIAIDGWKVLINSGTLESDASLTKAEFLAWFDCERQPSCEQLRVIIESFKLGNWQPEIDVSIINLIDDKFSLINDNYNLGLIELDTPTPPTDGMFIGQAINVGIYPNFGGLEVTEAELNDNIVYLYVINGVFQKKLKPVKNAEKEILEDFSFVPSSEWESGAYLKYTTNDTAYFNTAFGFDYKEGYAVATIWNSNIDQKFDRIRIDGDFSKGGVNCVTVFAGNNRTSNYVILKQGIITEKSIIFDLQRDVYDYFFISYLKSDFKLFYGSNNNLKNINAKEYVDKISKISELKKATIPFPKVLTKVNFETLDDLPTVKGNLIQGVFTYEDFNGTSFSKFGTIDVQGSSSAVFPKKNWTFAFYNDSLLTESFKLRIGNWVAHSEFVFKSNWIDATHSRNIVSNRIWEDMVQSRKYYPKRENEKLFTEITSNSINERFDSGALTHVDGFPCEMYINGEFYGIGMFNLGKKRENYDLESGNQNHIQLTAETHVNMESYVSSDWEIRNPKTPDSNFLNKINAWFAANALSGQSFKDAFPTNHNLNNAIDYFLLIEFLMANDAFDKNFILTSWDGVKFSFMPYDLDTTFGLRYEGSVFENASQTIRIVPFWDKFHTAYKIEIMARYSQLKAENVLTADNVYKHFSTLAKIFGREKYKQDLDKWWGVPSNSIIYTSLAQVMQWTNDRVLFMNTEYS